MGRKMYFFPALAVGMLLFASCREGQKHFITDPEYREQVHAKFLERRELAKEREGVLFTVFDHPEMTPEYREALEFLYAYMPLCDLAEYNGEYFFDQVEGAFRAREYFQWGKQIPEDIFRHFVLLPRVNNEYLDNARGVFFDELKERVEDLSMAEAALEVNHWCHEKVTYRATDARTSAPLALVKTSWGRCGEESAFTAAAMRAVGIPARQVYTPRWAHTDSNHAWVEVWIDGKWHYLGACEPESVLDVAWFTGPAKRAMMMNTNVPGPYSGAEEQVGFTGLISRINPLEGYADTRQLRVTVTDESGVPVPDARLKFKVYNYAEFSPILELGTDGQGQASIKTGRGDLFIWANKGEKYGYAKNTPEEGEITVVLNGTAGKAYEETIIMNVPPEMPAPELPEELVAENRTRLVHEDSLRNAYMATFANEKAAEKIARRTGLDRGKIYRNLFDAQGNWQEIARFIEKNKENPFLFPFLSSLREKDLRDTPADYLNDHLRGDTPVPAGLSQEMIVQKILSPRIGFELIKPWRSYFIHEAGLPKEEFRSGEAIKNYVVRNIQIADQENYVNCMLTPRGVHELKWADSRSRDIYFVALCRSMGIPAHLNPANSRPQYFEKGLWHDAVFVEEPVETVKPKGRLTVKASPDNVIEPGYGTHFTIARFENGDFNTLNYRGSNLFGKPLELDEGYYRLMTGSRANDGSVTIRTEYFELGPDKPHTVEIRLPEVEGKLFVKGIIDMNTTVMLNNGEKASLKEISKGKGLILCFADPDKEPTKHILQDIPAQRSELEAWRGGILFMVPDDKLSVSFNPEMFPGLPEQIVWGTDFDRALLNEAISVLKSDFKNNFPMTLYLSSNGGVLYSLEGYRIGTGEELLKVITREKNTFQ